MTLFSGESSKRTTRRSAISRNARLIVGTSVSLVLLVTVALGWLAWQLVAQENERLRQENDRRRQQAQDQREQIADLLWYGFQRRMSEADAWLSQMNASFGGTDAPVSDPATAPLLVSFSRAGVRVEPRGSLLYYPATPPPDSVDARFAEIERLALRSGDLHAVASALTALAQDKNPSVRAQAQLRMANVHEQSRRVDDALAAYSALSNEKRLIPSGDPYGLFARLSRAKLLAAANRQVESRTEAVTLLDALHSGDWVLRELNYTELDKEARALAGEDLAPPAPAAKLAISRAVAEAWKEWRGSPLKTRTHASAPVPILSLAHADAERMVLAIYAGDELERLSLAGNTEAMVVDEQDQVILGRAFKDWEPRATRSLSPMALPWRLEVTAALDGSDADLKKGRRTLIAAQVTIAILAMLVGVACYAMARGVLREVMAGQLQSDFVSAVSHEFRSPLTTLRQLTELLADGRIQDEGRRHRYYTVLERETGRLHRLVEDLLDFGRMNAGRHQYRRERLGFVDLVRDAIEEYRQHAETGDERRIEVSVGPEDLYIDADREAIMRVVRNLLENAVKYSPGASTVWVETRRENEAAVLAVRDEGIGIPIQEQAHVFEKFVRGDAAKRAAIPGTGIGLAMVKEIVQVHGGEVTVASEVGHGSIFTVRLPLSIGGAQGALR
jgi:signal transduction histidine kinase